MAAIGNISDREAGSSIRAKLNTVIDDRNTLDPASGVARTDTSQTFTGDQTISGDLTVDNLITVGNVDGRDVSADGTKLDTIETNADVTDTANVTAAGALMDSEVDADLKTFTLPANTTISAFGATLVDDAAASNARTTLGLVIGTDVQAFDADTAKTDVVQNFTAGQSGGITALADGATITPDMDDGNFFSVTLAGNRTLANPTNLVAGQSGSIFITQDGTGTRTLAYGSFWDFLGGSAPTLSTAINTVDRLDYVVRTTGSIHAALTKAWS